MRYKTEKELRWIHVRNALYEALNNAQQEKVFETLSKLQEAEIILRAIQNDNA